MRLASAFVCLSAFGLILAWGGAANAYCRATNCEPDGMACDPPSETDCGVPLFWGRDCVGIAMQANGTNQMQFDRAYAAVMASFGAWLEPFCDGLRPGIAVVDLGRIQCGNVEYNASAGNANVIVFRDDAWTHPDYPNQIALTTVTFNTDSGEIYDVDIEVNSALHTFTTTDTDVAYDLVSVLTHEAGHFFGLAHSPELDATMFELYEPGSVEERSLTEDDRWGMCATLPPSNVDPATCNPIPRHGFDALCAADQPEHGCSVSSGRSADPAAAVPALTMLLALAGRLRRRGGRGPHA